MREVRETVGTPVADDGFDDAMVELDAALAAMKRGDDGPLAVLLTEQDDATLFGAWGPIEHGHDRIIDTWHWVAARFGPEGENVQDIRTIHRSGDLAVTVGFERGTTQVDGGPITEMVIRVTHVLRKEPGGWRLVHRHADFAPADPRAA
jgi:ketosteroid isomerase-like protein